MRKASYALLAAIAAVVGYYLYRRNQRAAAAPAAGAPALPPPAPAPAPPGGGARLGLDSTGSPTPPNYVYNPQRGYYELRTVGGLQWVFSHFDKLGGSAAGATRPAIQGGKEYVFAYGQTGPKLAALLQATYGTGADWRTQDKVFVSSEDVDYLLQFNPYNGLPSPRLYLSAWVVPAANVPGFVASFHTNNPAGDDFPVNLPGAGQAD
jgi:hypothetical protein